MYLIHLIKKDILEAIKKIEINYEQMSAYTFNFYNQIDNKQIFKELIRCLQ